MQARVPGLAYRVKDTLWGRRLCAESESWVLATWVIGVGAEGRFTPAEATVCAKVVRTGQSRAGTNWERTRTRALTWGETGARGWVDMSELGNSPWSKTGFPGGAVAKSPPAHAGDARDVGWILGSGRSPGVGNGNPPQYFCLGNPKDRGAWWATVYGVTKKSDTARRLLRVPWTARRSNRSILKEINPEYSLEGLMLELKLQYFVHLMQRASLLEKTLMLGKIEGRRRRDHRGWDGWMSSPTQQAWNWAKSRR